MHTYIIYINIHTSIHIYTHITYIPSNICTNIYI
jgi:hypothetical protein